MTTFHCRHPDCVGHPSDRQICLDPAVYADSYEFERRNLQQEQIFEELQVALRHTEQMLKLALKHKRHSESRYWQKQVRLLRAQKDRIYERQ